MNKNTRQRFRAALKNFRTNDQGSTEFDIPVMRPGGYTMGKRTVRIGFVRPPERKKKAPLTGVNEIDALVAAADELLGAPKFTAPRNNPPPNRAAPKPLAKIKTA